MTSHPLPHSRPTGQIVTRFAPSPTGYMHVGGVRTALFAWLFARKHGDKGTFILRIEDTDKEREVEGSIQHIIESLRWLGITWEEGPDIGGEYGPYIQSQRLDTYREYAQILIDKGLAYADPYSQEELEAFRKKAEEEKRPFLYRDHRPDHATHSPEHADSSKPAVPWIDRDVERKPLRLRIPDEMIAAGQVKWNDLVRGELSAGPESLDDFILIKSDGYPTYNFAHIIDDLMMGVTHICRADEFISSTPKFIALYDALDITGDARPQMATLPPIMSPDGKKKLGKRDGAKDILAYRAEGYLPEAIVNFLAFIGWNPGDEREIMSIDEIVEAFDFAKVQSAGGKLNEDKLIWTNREYLTRMSDAEWSKRFFHYLNTDAKDTSSDSDSSANGGGNFDLKKKFADRGIDIASPLFALIMIEVFRERLSYFGELKDMIENGEFDYYWSAPLENPESDGVNDAQRIKDLLICPEKMRKNGAGEKIEVDADSTAAILNQVGEILEKHAGGGIDASIGAEAATDPSWTKESIKEALWPFAEHEGRGVVLWPLRVALSGAERSPDPFILASILGKIETLARVRAAIELLG